MIITVELLVSTSIHVLGFYNSVKLAQTYGDFAKLLWESEKGQIVSEAQ